MLDTEEWLSVTSKAAKVDPYVALLDIVIHIPRLLERTDALSRAKSSPTPPPDYNPAAALASLVQDSQALAARAFAWFASYERNGPRYNKAPLSSLPGFLAICNDHTFDPIFHFRSFATGICYMIYWMSMLILQSNTFGLLMAAAKARGGALEPKQLMLWDRELSGYADSMCRAVPFSCRPEAGYTGRFGTLTPLVAARKFFEKKGMQREIRWCEVAFYGTKVEGLYSYKPAIPIQPNMEFSRDVQGNKRYI
ncbi:hypothetical protein BS50DRAFT_566988 [Corynespora cassiicola Philippines]|uniref:Uncharacterized protein n=1 Tax=Corynespora cassiicola Philippines TaxID=1448308 RepID=A0A2T2P8X4_CORCC|nr:hypothetical protein BS50DRAFT_566988 [Corynespora cassiicola Philippines]